MLEVPSRRRHLADLTTRNVFGGALEIVAKLIDRGKVAGALQFPCRRLTYV